MYCSWHDWHGIECLAYLLPFLNKNMWMFWSKVTILPFMCLNMYFVVYALFKLLIWILCELLLFIIIIKLTYQVSNLWKRVKTCFVGIPKSCFTTNLCNKLISSWEVLIVKIVIPNPFPIYLECMFVYIFHFVAKGQKALKGLMCKFGKK